MHDGRHKDKYRPEKGGVLVLVKKFGEGKDEEIIKVTRDDVKKYVEDPVFLYYLNVYNMIKLWDRFPNGEIGWANEDCYMMDAITALEIEQREIEQDAIPSKDKGSSNAEALEKLRRQ